MEVFSQMSSGGSYFPNPKSVLVQPDLSTVLFFLGLFPLLAFCTAFFWLASHHSPFFNSSSSTLSLNSYATQGETDLDRFRLYGDLG